MKRVSYFIEVGTLKTVTGLELCLISVNVHYFISLFLTSSLISKAGNMFENMSLCSAYRSYNLKSLNFFSFNFPIYYWNSSPLSCSDSLCWVSWALDCGKSDAPILQYFLSSLNGYLIWSNLLIVAVFVTLSPLSVLFSFYTIQSYWFKNVFPVELVCSCCWCVI
jgi:hypothetical protein